MADDVLGSDFSGLWDIAPSLPVVSGRICLAQCIARRFITPVGGLFYDPEYGAGLMGYLNGTTDDVGTLSTRLENEALKDERVDDVNVTVTLEDRTLTVSVQLEDGTGPFEFVLSANQLKVALFIPEAA